MEGVMRRVKIIDQPENAYPYAAIDRKTGETPLRHHDRSELVALCRRLEWQIEDAKQNARALRPDPGIRRERKLERPLRGTKKSKFLHD